MPIQQETADEIAFLAEQMRVAREILGAIKSQQKNKPRESVFDVSFSNSNITCSLTASSYLCVAILEAQIIHCDVELASLCGKTLHRDNTMEES